MFCIFVNMNSMLWMCAAGLGLSSLLGSLIGLGLRRIPHKANDLLLGLCGGMMLTAAIVCLLMPAVEAVGVTGLWQPLAGVGGGVALVGVLDRITPHLHTLSGVDPESHANNHSIDKVLLFVAAIALHKFPEGLATGIAFDEGNPGNSLAITIAIALQNIPEGLVVVTPLLVVGVKMPRVSAIALTVAMIEVGGMLLGQWLGTLSALMLPSLLGVAGGAMLYIISDEIIPETHSHGYQSAATYALVAGVLIMLVIERLV